MHISLFRQENMVIDLVFPFYDQANKMCQKLRKH
jgi:hypothetical protein